MKKMRALGLIIERSWEPLAAIWGVNGVVLAVIKLSDVRDIIAILLGLVSIISTVLVIQVNARKLKSKNPNENS